MSQLLTILEELLRLDAQLPKIDVLHLLWLEILKETVNKFFPIIKLAESVDFTLTIMNSELHSFYYPSTIAPNIHNIAQKTQ